MLLEFVVKIKFFLVSLEFTHFDCPVIHKAGMRNIYFIFQIISLEHVLCVASRPDGAK